VKRHLVAGLSILAVVAGVGWSVSRHPETSASLQEIGLQQRSEHSHRGPTSALAGIRIRLSGSDLGQHIRAKDDRVPRIALAPR
jgi:hypothetical protein